MVRVLLLSLVLLFGCATEIQRAECSCSVTNSAGERVCRMEQDARTFKRRPALERVGSAISGIFGW